MDRGAWRATVWGHKELDTTEHTLSKHSPYKPIRWLDLSESCAGNNQILLPPLPLGLDLLTCPLKLPET